ncbi:Nucleotidyltransferase [Artomyces pyxidatus]|uniref:Nucleotidyltransferase n=1 Tax=Artomyces pyxidatus TaxID=48021 RepID=A0ACB8T1M3_9AGAM|nr:Nucleotidyltransferase [Artomyces pyxidatus]
MKRLQSNSSSSSPSPLQKRPKRPPSPSSSNAASNFLHGRNIYILQAKLTPATIAELFALAEKGGATVVSNPEDAEVVVTAVGMRKRLERHLDWEVAKSKALVTPAWLRDSFAQGQALPCGSYAALSSLHDTTVANCPTDSDSEPEVAPAPSTAYSKSHTQKLDIENIPENLLPPRTFPKTDLAKLDHTARFSCARASPLTCLNQGLCNELDVMRRLRELEGEERSALSYRRAVASIKSYPRKLSLSDHAEIHRLPYIGAKIFKMVEEYLDTGKIGEVEAARKSERFTSLQLFASVYGIGPSTARDLYARGLRSVRDLEAFYEVEGPLEVGAVETDAGAQGVDMDIKIALGLRQELALPIPRVEVEMIHRVIMDELEVVQPGCVSTIVGGYRRGKTASNDVDIVFTHPDGTKTVGLCTKLVKRLHERGLVTHVMHLSSFHAHNALRTHHWDSLEKSLTVFRPPSPDATRRRVDLIFALPQTYWTAVVGWTGSTMFERDLRSAAKAQGMKFDSSGITRRHDSKVFYPRTEKEVFDIFGLPWIDPSLRNADA